MGQIFVKASRRARAHTRRSKSSIASIKRALPRQHKFKGLGFRVREFAENSVRRKLEYAKARGIGRGDIGRILRRAYRG